jgi:type VI secretion system protein ImpH
VRTPKGQLKPSVMQRLIDEPYRFEFFQAVGLILAFLRENGIGDERAFGQVLRFDSTVQLSFPASEIESLRGGGEVDARVDRMLRLAAKDPSTLRINITPAFIGFLGTCGVLPFHYSERIAAHQKSERNIGARAFMDVFSNRLVGQFYLAWKKYRLEYSGQNNGKDLQLSILLALAGRSRIGSPDDHALAFYSTLFRTRPASAHAISRVLTEHFAVPIKLEECVGSWDEIPVAHRSRLRSAGPRLGLGAALGTRLWRHDRRVRLHIGPLNSENLVQFLPRSEGAVSIGKMLALFDVGPIEFEVRLTLQQKCVHPLTLTTKPSQSTGGLGWATFLTSRVDAISQPEVRYMLALE